MAVYGFEQYSLLDVDHVYRIEEHSCKMMSNHMVKDLLQTLSKIAGQSGYKIQKHYKHQNNSDL